MNLARRIIAPGVTSRKWSGRIRRSRTTGNPQIFEKQA